MSVRAIVVLGESGSVNPDFAYARRNPPAFERLEWFSGGPISSLEVFGYSALQRTIQRLQSAGIETLALVAKDNASHLTDGRGRWPRELITVRHSLDVWFSAQHIFGQYLKDGVATVVLLRLGAYIEFDFADIMKFHREAGQPVTRVKDRQGFLDFWIFDSARCIRVGIALSHAMGIESDARITSFYDNPSYVNRLANASDLRRWVVDTFHSRCSVRPAGRETRPGIWVDASAMVDQRARLVPPVYVGAETKIGASALITRFSNVECGCDVDCGTVVDNSSILADTYLGTWLDVSHAVVHGSALAHLHRNAIITIEDSKLISSTGRGSHGQEPMGIPTP